MTTFRNFVLALAAMAGMTAIAPLASANIIYSICSSCTVTSGSYATTAGAPQAVGLTFPSPISFSAGANLSGAAYTDPTTGIVITAWNGLNNPGSASVNASNALVNTNSGANTGFEITLPANVFAFSFNYSSVSSLNGALAVNSTNLSASNFSVFGYSGYVSIISDTALTSLFFGANSGGPITLNNFQPGTGGGGGGGATPEPSTILLLGSGLIGMLWVRRRRSPQTIPRQIRP